MSSGISGEMGHVELGQPQVSHARQHDVPVPESQRAIARVLGPSALDKAHNRAVKRAFDIAVSLVALVCTSWIMAIVWIAIKLESRGSAFFSRLDDGSPLRRIGRDGVPFPYAKFRSMRAWSHNERYTSLAPMNTRSGPLVKIRNDPRITRVGKFIRETHLDELPEFWLVLMGHMSVVGPRPHMPEEVAKYAQWQRKVLRVKPGITGLSQVRGGHRLSFSEEVANDFAYIVNWSIWQDMLIVLATVPAICRRGRE